MNEHQQSQSQLQIMSEIDTLRNLIKFYTATYDELSEEAVQHVSKRLDDIIQLVNRRINGN